MGSQGKNLLIARDRYGIKPLYYAQQGTRFAFGSEQKAILAQPEFQKRLNKSALLEYFTFQNIFTDQTLLEDIQASAGRPLRNIKCQNLNLPVINIGTTASANLSIPPTNANTSRSWIDYSSRRVNRQLVSDVELGLTSVVAWIPVRLQPSQPNNSRT